MSQNLETCNIILKLLSSIRFREHFPQILTIDRHEIQSRKHTYPPSVHPIPSARTFFECTWSIVKDFFFCPLRSVLFSSFLFCPNINILLTEWCFALHFSLCAPLSSPISVCNWSRLLFYPFLHALHFHIISNLAYSCQKEKAHLPGLYKPPPPPPPFNSCMRTKQQEKLSLLPVASWFGLVWFYWRRHFEKRSTYGSKNRSPLTQ